MFEKYTVNTSYTVQQATEKMVNNNIKAVIVLEDEKVVGLFSNGDMRCFFLSGGMLSANITVAMNSHPILYKSREEVEREKEKQPRVIYPIVDNERRLVYVEDGDSENRINSAVSEILCDIPLVIMAGGKGTRLYPYTKVLPKPLIPIGDKTIVERIIERFGQYGCKKVIMLLNHKADMIRAYFNECDIGQDIEFEIEPTFLGTAGGLKLIENKVKSTFFLSNCDILINDDIECAYRTHIKNNNKITMVCSMKNITIPYGIVETDDVGKVVGMREKPSYSYLINTGVYLIEPDVIELIGCDEFIHMPDLARRCMDRGYNVGVFPISEESWLDMGQMSELKRMLGKLNIDAD